MIETSGLRGFMLKLSSCVFDIRTAKEICLAERRRRDGISKIMATSILQVLLEIQAYLLEYREHIEKPFGVPASQEESRILQAVMNPFKERLSGLTEGQEKIEELLSETVNAVAELIARWDSLRKESAEEILSSDRSPEK